MHHLALLCALLCALLLPSLPSRAGTLCRAGEPVLFSCSAGGQTVSLCRFAGAGQAPVYRSGTPDKEEWHAPGAVTRSTHPAVGGGVTTWRFRRGTDLYTVYSSTGRDGGMPVSADGVRITRHGKLVTDLVCTDSAAVQSLTLP